MRTALLLLVCIWIDAASAAPFAVQVGESRVALDAPPGFADSLFTGSPRLIELAESLTPAANRILLFALEDGDLRRFTVGDSPVLRRTALIATPRAMERDWLTPPVFRTFAGEALRDERSPAAPPADLVGYLDAQPPGRANRIAALRTEAEVMSVLLGTRELPRHPDEPPRYLLATHTLMLVRGKALDLSLFSRFESAEDLEWIRAATARWIEELQRLNSR